ncbi:MAG: hypothetical protein OIF57_11435 [Marinobacterium sp.]|nr:hypothetical protein [Marinobacterium sp.]
MNNLIVSARWDLIELLNGQTIRLDLEDDHEFTLAASTLVARERLQEEMFNCVLLDSSSPGVDALALMDELISNERPEWILLLTTAANESYLEAGKRERDEMIRYDATIAEIFAMVADFPDNGYSGTLITPQT